MSEEDTSNLLIEVEKNRHAILCSRQRTMSLKIYSTFLSLLMVYFVADGWLEKTFIREKSVETSVETLVEIVGSSKNRTFSEIASGLVRARSREKTRLIHSLMQVNDTLMENIRPLVENDVVGVGVCERMGKE